MSDTRHCGNAEHYFPYENGIMANECVLCGMHRDSANADWRTKHLSKNNSPK